MCNWPGFLPSNRWLTLLAVLALSGACNAIDSMADDDFDSFGELDTFVDSPLPEALAYPDWFKLSFLDLGDDLREAVDGGKQGLLVYFGQKYCAYCRQLLEVNFGKQDIVDYTREHFDVVGMDIHGQRPVTAFNGSELSRIPSRTRAVGFQSLTQHLKYLL